MRFYIKTLTGNVIVIRDISGSETVWELKRRVYEQTEVPIEVQRIIFAGKQLENHITLNDYNVESECTFHLVFLETAISNVTVNSYKETSSKIVDANPIELQYYAVPVPSSSLPRGKSRTDSYLSRSKNYQELYLHMWGDGCGKQSRPPSKRPARDLKYQQLIEDVLQNKMYLVFDPPPKGWRKAARKVLPEVLTKCGYSQSEIQFIKGTKIFDVMDAIAYIKQRRIELIKPSSELTPLFIKHYDVVWGTIFPYFSLQDRMNFSLTCQSFNKIARQPVVWKHLCLLHDRARVTNKHFVNILNQYGDCIYALSIQRCLKLTGESLKLIGDKCPNLRVLNAAGNQFFNEEEQNAVFSKATKLQVLNLSMNKLATVKPIGSISALKELKELNMAGRVQPWDGIIANVNLKVLDIRYCNGDLRIDCPQLERLIVDKPHSHPKHTIARTASRFVSYGASDPRAFTPITQVADGPDEYVVAETMQG